MCPSQHGSWVCTTDGFTLSGTRPLLEYYSVFPVNHALANTKTEGGSQPLVAWESLPGAAVDALQSADFGDASVPFKDADFDANLASATF